MESQGSEGLQSLSKRSVIIWMLMESQGSEG